MLLSVRPRRSGWLCSSYIKLARHRARHRQRTGAIASECRLYATVTARPGEGNASKSKSLS
ncbi:unnamed protein product, partial [Diplocarpon coronariae]